MTNIRYFMAAAFRNLWESKVTSLFTAITLSVALGFLGAYMAIFINMKAAIGTVSEEFPLTVYLDDRASAADKGDIESALVADPSVAGHSYTSKEDALDDFTGRHKDDRSLIGGLKQNPLPASFDVKLRADAGQERVSGLVKKLKGMAGVDEVQYLQEEAGKLRSLLYSFRMAGIVLGLGVLLGVVFISYSTLRLAVLAHADEIAVMKLMGATRLFIMGPFLLEGVIQGVVAAVLSLGLIYGLLRVITGASAFAFLTPTGTLFLPPLAWAGTVFVGGLLGLTGSFFAFTRTLRM